MCPHFSLCWMLEKMVNSCTTNDKDYGRDCWLFTEVHFPLFFFFLCNNIMLLGCPHYTAVSTLPYSWVCWLGSHQWNVNRSGITSEQTLSMGWCVSFILMFTLLQASCCTMPSNMQKRTPPKEGMWKTQEDAKSLWLWGAKQHNNLGTPTHL